MKRFKKIYIEITNICNLSCSFCPKDELIKKEMTLKELEVILQKIDSYTDYVYLHVKGEPLLHSKFEKVIELCLKYGKNINITTNGTLIKKRFESLKKIRQLNVSLQSVVDIKTADEIVSYCERLSNDIYISYRFWVSSKFEEYLKSKIVLKKNIFINEDKQFIWPSLNNEMIREVGTCYGTRDHIAILVDGTIVPCCLDSTGNINLGNIFKENLSEILNKDRFINMCEGFKNNKLVEELCTKCGWNINNV